MGDFDSMYEKRVAEILESMRSMSIEEVHRIWYEKDTDTWTEESLEAARRILMERGVIDSTQESPQLKSQIRTSGKSAEIPGIGKVPLRPLARKIFYLFLIVSWPFSALGGIGLAYTIVHIMFPSSDETSEFLFRTLVGGAIALALIGIGLLIRFAARKIPGGFFYPGDWLIVMQEAMQNKNRVLAQGAAKVLTKIRPEAQDELLIVSAAHKYLADRFDKTDSWAASLELIDKAMQLGFISTESKLDRALALQKLKRFDEAIAACDDVIASASYPIVQAYMIKAVSQEGAGNIISAISTWKQLESEVARLPDGDDIRSTAKDKILELEKGKEKEDSG